MGDIKTAVVDTVTGFFHADGRRTADTIVVAVSDNPDPVRHRYSGDRANPIRNATAEEIAAAATAALAAKADAAINEHRVVKALVLAVAELTGKTPTQVLTVVKAKYQSLS